MKQTKRRNFKRPLSLLLAVMMLFTLIPAGAFTVGVGAVENETITADTSWYNDTDTEFTLNDAADLLGFAELASGGNVFTSETIKLGADIDLNPGWSSETSLNKDFTYGSAGQTAVTFPSAPSNVWTAIPTFEGTFDGQGHTIRGIYVNQEFVANGNGTGIFCYIQNGAVVKNLVVKNSLIRGFTTSTTYWNVHVGGISGWAKNSTVSNIFCDMEVWYCNSSWGTTGGIVGTASDVININNCVFNGVVGNGYSLSSADATTTKAPCGSSVANLAQILGQGQAYANTITDCLAIGKSYYLNSTGNRYGAITPSTATTNTTQTRCYSASVAEANTPEGWTYRGDYNTALPTSVSNMLIYPTVTKSINDFDGTEAVGSTFTIGTVDELLTFSQKGQTQAFTGYNVVLTADIDLNPGWSAVTSLDKDFTYGSAQQTTVTFPSAPSNVWTAIPTFEGTFDGQGHTIRGIYVNQEFVANGNQTGIFCYIENGTVKNLVIKNSLIRGFTASTTYWNVHVGGIAGRAKNSTVSNIFCDMEVWYCNSNWGTAGGIVGTANDVIDINNCVFNGVVGNGYSLSSADATTTKAPCGSSVANLAQILGQGQAYANTITDCLAIGKSYYLNSTGNRYGAITPSTATTNTTQTRCYSASVTEANTPEGWTYRWDYNTALPNSLSAILPTSATTMSEYASTGIAGSSITVSTAEELILAAQLSQSGDTFSGKTIVLTANIDLNPNWDATVTVTSGNATLPAIPTVIFPGFATFSGTLDGQNHTINGIFMTKRFRL